MPDDESYLSVTPYTEQTHECFFHGLTTCLGELADMKVDVTVTNAATGDVLAKETLATYSNDFVGLWLPRNIDAELTVTGNERTATQAISTRDGDPACLTTLRVA